ncbi:LOW QUALITY PROTEIN: hypothetical protein PHMEG_00014381 [Phytophthora megakarya]|uniref:Uncharacterized protein n=1 Tax=Phytophthora megakarya TaxID=4795 RepID=A0A225W4F7_9STRA|nr:LOW QUALITY PROTEIN: hypothetical protein PHMEG_00014381 [Phytophthora megakarya]
MMETHKTYIREMTAQGIKPSRIRNSMPSKFGVDMDSLSSLSKEQNYSYHYKKTKLLNHDKHKDITEFVHKLEFSDHETRQLLLHLDGHWMNSVKYATFKLNQVDYPVIVCGISDRSQRTEYQYLECLRSLRNVFTRMAGKALLVSTVMGNAEDAQFNAFNGYLEKTTIVEKTKGMPEAVKDRVFRGIYNIHFSRSMEQCTEFVRVNVAAWRDSPETKEFAEYFVNQGRFVHWQYFHTVCID